MLHFTMSDHAAWSRRVGISLKAGLDIVSTLQREAGELDERFQKMSRDERIARHATNRPDDFAVEKEHVWQLIADKVANGSSLKEALKSQRLFFPKLLIAMVGVGEQSGHLGETLIDMAHYYDTLVKMRNEFLRMVARPVFQLIFALTFIGFLILVLGILRDITGQAIDPFRLGMFGFFGFVQYVIVVSIPCGIGYMIYRYIRANLKQGNGRLHYRLDRLPKIGQCFRNMAMARLTMAMNMTFRTGMDVRRALKLSFEAASYAPITDHLPQILENIDEGKTLCRSFPVTELFDQNFFLFLRAGEESGNLPEALQKLADDYSERSKTELRTLSLFIYFLVTGIVMLVLIILILRGYAGYFGYLGGV